MIDAGVIRLEEGAQSKCGLVFGQMNESAGVRMRVALTGLTQAEFFRDIRGQDVLLFIDNIFRFTQAGAEVSSLLGRIPSAVGYQSTLEWEIGCVQDRICSTIKGSITSVQAVYVPADDLTDPAPATTFQHLDATTVLSRKVSEKGIYPCVDPIDSTSRMMMPDVIGLYHFNVAQRIIQHFQKNNALSDIIAILGMDELSEADKNVVYRSRKMERFSSQPFAVAQAFTNMAGVYVTCEESLRGFKSIMDGDVDDMPDMAFYMVGGLEQVAEKGAKLAAEAAMPSPRASIRYKFGKLIGFVRSTKMNKSITVDVPWYYQLPKHGFVVEKRMRIMAHDEYELCEQGDLVQLRMSRPLSKNKSHIVQAIVKKEDGSEPPHPFPTVPR